MNPWKRRPPGKLNETFGIMPPILVGLGVIAVTTAFFTWAHALQPVDTVLIFLGEVALFAALMVPISIAVDQAADAMDQTIENLKQDVEDAERDKFIVEQMALQTALLRDLVELEKGRGSLRISVAFEPKDDAPHP